MRSPQNVDHENYGLQTEQTENIFRILVFAFTFDSHILKKKKEFRKKRV